MGGRPGQHDTGCMPLTVVVVDDDPAFRRVVTRLLRLRGIDVVADAADGKSALEAVRRHRPDGVLLDVNLPDHSGICVTRTLTAHRDAPAIVLTSTESTGCTPEDIAACGARAFVLKDGLPHADLHGLFSAAGT
jgi:DNA-binding NarL/FixJ family response regulator